MEDYYELLGVKRTANARQIERAYRKAAKSCHPDTVSGREEEFLLLTKARDTLKDPASRREYDLAFPPEETMPVDETVPVRDADPVFERETGHTTIRYYRVKEEDGGIRIGENYYRPEGKTQKSILIGIFFLAAGSVLLSAIAIIFRKAVFCVPGIGLAVCASVFITDQEEPYTILGKERFLLRIRLFSRIVDLFAVLSTVIILLFL